MEIKLIASDMDDTLLNKDCQISPRNEAAIRKALDAGKIFLMPRAECTFPCVPMRKSWALMCRWLPITRLVKGSLSGKVYYEHKMKLPTANEYWRTAARRLLPAALCG